MKCWLTKCGVRLNLITLWFSFTNILNLLQFLIACLILIESITFSKNFSFWALLKLLRQSFSFYSQINFWICLVWINLLILFCLFSSLYFFSDCMLFSANFNSLSLLILYTYFYFWIWLYLNAFNFIITLFPSLFRYTWSA